MHLIRYAERLDVNVERRQTATATTIFDPFNLPRATEPPAVP